MRRQSGGFLVQGWLLVSLLSIQGVMERDFC